MCWPFTLDLGKLFPISRSFYASFGRNSQNVSTIDPIISYLYVISDWSALRLNREKEEVGLKFGKKSFFYGVSVKKFVRRTANRNSDEKSRLRFYGTNKNWSTKMMEKLKLEKFRDVINFLNEIVDLKILLFLSFNRLRFMYKAYKMLWKFILLIISRRYLFMMNIKPFKV